MYCARSTWTVGFPRRFPFLPSLALFCSLIWASPASAQELEPRAYANLPVGLNFAVFAYAYSEGGLSVDPSLPVDDAHLEIHTTAVAYARSLNFGGMSGKFDMAVPYSWLSGTASVAGQPASREVSGFHDPRLRVSVNFYGAPALDLREYAKRAASGVSPLVIGGSLAVAPPLGQYDSTKLINLGTNRWAIRPDFGFSKKVSNVTFDMTVGVTCFTDNDNFSNGKHVDQDPIWSTQANLSYDFGKGIWAALGYTYYAGGRTTIDGVRKDNELGNSRAGLTVSLPINRYYSAKFNVSRGISTRTGSSFNTYGIGLSYRWGAGL